MVTTEQVHLTSDMQSKQGAVWSRIPCHLRALELQVHFKIHSQVMKNLNGDVLAIWYTKERMQEDPVFGNQDLFTGLGVLVDTYPNEEKHLETGAEDEVHHTHTGDQAKDKVTLQQRIYPFVLAMVSAPPCCATTITLSSSSDASAAGSRL
eukprot:XP_013990921.1 PREDICTED: VIP36-like protein isoform X5 [Salmo salar]